MRPAIGPLAALLARLENEPFSSPRLRQIHEALRANGQAASRRLVRFERLLAMELPALLLGLRPQLAVCIEPRMRKVAGDLADWLRCVGEVESLASLANRSRECPHERFPEIVEEGPLFEARELGHPFLPDDRCVRNDVTLDAAQRLLIVSGSNMAGKSTFLRTVGINAVLALCGATVRASRLRLSPLAVGATLRVEDSLLDGRSRFFAEAVRIRQLLDMARGPVPLLFLLDELFQGTNSRDRRVGAEAILSGLLERSAVGIVTTHDLALTEIADCLAPNATNIHFKDQIVDGKLCFDYRVRQGVVPASNALELLRSLGIDVK
jgi:DNA mismatch repair ATPase MutS